MDSNARLRPVALINHNESRFVNQRQQMELLCKTLPRVILLVQTTRVNDQFIVNDDPLINNNDQLTNELQMTMHTTDQPSNTSSWRSIRPWTPHLILSVREITSVSATFILSSTLSPPFEPDLNADHESSIPATTNTNADPDIEPELETELEVEADGELGGETEGDTVGDTARGIISEALSTGLSVSVNGSPWQRVLIRLLEPVDEAVIIIYGLMPGRQYDIDLGLVQGGLASSIRRQVVTEGVCTLI